MSVRVTNLLAPLLIEVALLLLHNVLRPLPLQRRDHLVRVRARARVGGWGLGLGLGLGLVQRVDHRPVGLAEGFCQEVFRLRA